MILSPSPSIFIAFLETKWIREPVFCAGQSNPAVHRRIASPSTFIRSFLQQGSLFGEDIFFESIGLLSNSTEIIWGITSPALFTFTVSPSLTSRRSISSKLWILAWETITPPMFTGSNSATGVILPTLPTWKEIFLTKVVPTSAGNFLAIAHLGALETWPNVIWSFKSLTLNTTPSISYGNFCRWLETFSK